MIVRRIKSVCYINNRLLHKGYIGSIYSNQNFIQYINIVKITISNVSQYSVKLLTLLSSKLFNLIIWDSHLQMNILKVWLKLRNFLWIKKNITRFVLQQIISHPNKIITYLLEQHRTLKTLKILRRCIDTYYFLL